MAKLYTTFFSGVFACNCVWSFEQPVVFVASGVVSFVLYSIAWCLE